MIKIEWSEILATGIEVIDEDHLYLVGLINQLHDELNANKTDRVSFILEELCEYANEHFHREETLLSLCHYEKFEDHQESHHAITKKIKTIFELYQEMPSLVSLEGVQEFLADWLSNHILYEDHLYIDVLKKEAQFINSLRGRV